MGEIMLLTPISEPAANTKTVLENPSTGTVFFKGPDLRDPYWGCGTCKALLAEHISLMKLGDVVLKCKVCGTFNDTRSADQASLTTGNRGENVLGDQ